MSHHHNRPDDAHPPDAPEQLSFDADLIDYWRAVTRQFPAMSPEQIAAVAAITQRIDHRRENTTHDGNPHRAA